MVRLRPRRAVFAVIAAALAGVLLWTSWTWWGERSSPLPELTVATGNPGGVYHVYGDGLAEILQGRTGSPFSALATAASVQNLRMVAAGEADIAFTLADVAALAVVGEHPFSGALPIAALARVYDNRTHLIVDAEVPVERSEDLAGLRVSVGARHSGTELIADRVLELSGLDPSTDIQREQLDLVQAAEALADGELDALFWSGGLPTSAVTELAEQTPIRLVDLAEHVEELRRSYGDFFTAVSIPRDTYPGVGNVGTIGVPNLLVVGTDMPPETAERLTRELFAAREDLIAVHDVALQLNPRAAVATLPVPLHPGAADYYRSQKVAYSATEP